MKQSGDDSQGLAPSHAKKKRLSPSNINPFEAARVKALYFSGQSVAQIAPHSSLTPLQIKALIDNRGWNAERASRSASYEALSEQALHDSLTKHALDSAALQAAQILPKAIQLTGDSLQEGNAKNAMYASATAKNLAELTKLNRSTEGNGGINFSLSFSFQGGSQGEKHVKEEQSEAVELSSIPSKASLTASKPNL